MPKHQYDASQKDDGRLNAWPEADTEPCAEIGEHLDTAKHPYEECPTYSEDEEGWE